MAQSETKQPEKNLRVRIRQAFGAPSGDENGFSTVEDLVVDLLNEYATAHKDFRESVYRKGEKRILQAARKIRG